MPGRAGFRASFAALLLLAAVGCAGHRPVEPTTPAASSAAIAPQPLNSERIAGRFGSYGIEVLEGQGAVRVANLYSGAGSER